MLGLGQHGGHATALPRSRDRVAAVSTPTTRSECYVDDGTGPQPTTQPCCISHDDAITRPWILSNSYEDTPPGTAADTDFATLQRPNCL